MNTLVVGLRVICGCDVFLVISWFSVNFYESIIFFF